MTDFSFNPQTRRYHDNRTKKFISVARVRELVATAINERINRTNRLTRDMLSERITVREWESRMSEEIKILTIQLYRIGKPDMTQSDYGRIGAILRSQYARLRKFSRDIILGTQTEKQILNRSKRYIAKAREAFEEGNRRGNALVNRWERRIRTKTESCRECIVYEAAGWQPIGTLPRPTDRCSCRDNCGCYFEFSNSRTRPTTNLLAGSSWGWL
jgi:hypothetical protein